MDALRQRRDKHVETLDTTLRDGEQTPGVSFKPEEKRHIAGILLSEVGVDRVEICSARVSEGEGEGAAQVIAWADKKGWTDRVEILGFVDNGKSVDWIKNIGGKVINMLTKGSERHCLGQLRKNPGEHFADISRNIEKAAAAGLAVNVYLEDWSNGVLSNFDYVYRLTKELSKHPVARVMLADTLGVLNPCTLRRALEWMFSAFPDLRYDFHGHNDYGLVTGNSLAAVKAGIDGVHTTVNGLGERAGNQPLCEIAAAINDMTDRKTKIKENRLEYITLIVQTISGKRISPNKPIVGADVFTQTCGVHADGDKKGNLYANPLLPERFSRHRSYALGKLSGKASIDQNLKAMGMELSDEMRDMVLSEVIRIGDKKKRITPQDLPFIISDVLKRPSQKLFEITHYDIINRFGEMPRAAIKVRHKGHEHEASAKGDGGYDAFMRALRKILRGVGVKPPKLMDYEVRIPPGGKTDALVETTITWMLSENEAPLVTIGVDSDQIGAAIEATEKMLNLAFRPAAGAGN